MGYTPAGVAWPRRPVETGDESQGAPSLNTCIRCDALLITISTPDSNACAIVGGGSLGTEADPDEAINVDRPCALLADNNVPDSAAPASSSETNANPMSMRLKMVSPRLTRLVNAIKYRITTANGYLDRNERSPRETRRRKP